MVYVELELPSEAEKLGISNIACSEGVFLVVYLGKEYSCAFPSAIWGIDKDQQATIEYLYDRLTNGDGPIPPEIATSISKTIKKEANWKRVEEHADTLDRESQELDQEVAINKIDKNRRDQDEELTEEEKRIQELINTPVTEEDINFIFETLSKEAPHDKISIKQLFYGMCSAFTRTGIPHNVNSKDSGAGKNYLLELCSRVFPEKYVEQFVGVSDKAFVHRRGQPVIENKNTGQLTFIQPIIKQLNEDLNDITDNLATEKCASSKTRDYKKIGELTVQQNKKTREIRELREKSQKYFSLGDLIIIISDTPQEGFLATFDPTNHEETWRKDSDVASRLMD